MNNTWDVHFENYQRTSNSTVTPTTAPDTTGNNKTTVTYEVTLTNPGDIYEFTLDVVNSGTMDVMIESFSSKLNGVEITPSTLPPYLSYSATYSDDTPIASKQKLVHNTRETLKLRVKYRDDIATTALPSTVQDLTFSFSITYVQDDGTSIPVRVDFATATWDEIIDTYTNNTQALLSSMNAGATKEVALDLDLDGTTETTGHVRIANLSTPAECSANGFSQSACGLVIEFADVITRHNMDSTNENVGGWPASEMRTYLNDETPGAASIYNALPSELSSKIIPTYVVSGYGCMAFSWSNGACSNLDNNGKNYTSTDKIYLLSTKEVGYDRDYDTVKTETKILDYYNADNQNSRRIKKSSSNVATEWWLRSPELTYVGRTYYVSVAGITYYSYTNYEKGVSPAFRIGNTN